MAFRIVVINQEFILKPGGDDAREVQDALLKLLEDQHYDAGSCFAIRLALEEGLSNAFKHGNGGDPSKIVKMTCRISPDEIDIAIRDEGPGFDPEAVPDPTQDENLEIPSGRGIVLMRSFMTEVRYEPPGNVVRMRYVRPEASGEAAAG